MRKSKTCAVKMLHRFLRMGRRWQVFLLRRGLSLFSGSHPGITDKPILVVAPHQDDETLGCGGLIALKRAADVAVQIVFLTDGSAATNPNPATTKEDFVLRRRQEALGAMKILNIDESCVSFLNIVDATLGDARSSEIATEQLTALLMAHSPQEIYAPHQHDCHPDHEAAWRISHAAIQRAGLKIELIQYPIWMLWSAPLFWHLFPWHLAGARRLCIRSVRAQKQQAIAAYDSQCTTLPQGFLGQFLGSDEIFLFQDKT